MTALVRHLQVCLQRFCKLGCVLALSLTLALTLLNIVLRWCGLSLFWIEPLVRHLVFLGVFLGGVLATRQGGHMAIDLCGGWIERKHPKLRWWHHKLLSLVSTASIAWLAVASWPLVQTEWQYGRESFLNIHSSFLVALVPLGFALMALSFLCQLILEPEPRNPQWNS